MRRVFILMVFLTHVAFTISAQEKITGIGKLKLYCSPDVLKEIGFDAGKAKPITTQSEYFANVYKKYTGTSAYVIMPDKTLKDGVINAQALFASDVVVYYIPNYTPVDGVILEGLTLKFRNDSLFCIDIKSYKGLSDAFDLKYGKAELDKKEKEKHYTNGYGNKITKVDMTITSTWNSGDANISCYSTISKYHNDKGAENYLSYFILQDMNMTEQVRNADTAAKQLLRSALDASKKQSLGDL